MSNGLSNTAAGGAARDFDALYKLLLIGDTSVGKTCLLFRYCDESFQASHITTVGIDFKVKTVTVNNKKVKLQIWDTAGQERFRTITNAYYRGALGFLILYDVSNESTFTNVKHWMENIKANAEANCQIVLVGNKCDVEPELRQVSAERGIALAAEYHCPFFETSAKKNIAVDQAFDTLVQKVTEQIQQGTLIAPSSKWNKGQVDLNKVPLNDTVNGTSSDQCAC